MAAAPQLLSDGITRDRDRDRAVEVFSSFVRCWVNRNIKLYIYCVYNTKHINIWWWCGNYYDDARVFKASRMTISAQIRTKDALFVRQQCVPHHIMVSLIASVL